MDAKPHVLVVDDDREIRELTSRFLQRNGLRVETAANGIEMSERLVSRRVDLIVLDRVMPGEDGLDLCRDLRRHSRVPIIILTLLGAETERIRGLQLGADDYLQKPFSPDELLARIQAVLRRSTGYINTSTCSILRFAGWTLDLNRRRLLNPAGAAISLTDGEYDLLLAFVHHSQVILSRDQLLDLARGRSTIAFDRSIDMQVMRLRRKLERNRTAPDLIQTVRNKGYVFIPEVVRQSDETKTGQP
jgi:two-component system OmpR family response regulator